MKYRKDIHDFILGNFDDKHHKDYKPYQGEDNLIYAADYRLDNPNKISNFADYSFYDDTELKERITNNFNVEFASEDCIIVCRCGKNDSFSARYGRYELILICSCGNEFSAYSG